MEYFSEREFECHCCKGLACIAKPMKKDFLVKLEALAKEWGTYIEITSGRRCLSRNIKVGGAPHSQHLYGNAVDLHFDEPSDTKKFALLAEKFGFNGIGLGIHLLHIDNREKRAHWSYDK